MAYLIHVMGLSREVAKALIIDSAAGWDRQDTIKYEKGYGIVPKRIEDILYSREDEIRFIMSGSIDEYEVYTYNIPVPQDMNAHPFFAKATLAYFPQSDRNQGVDYTSTEMDIHFGARELRSEQMRLLYVALTRAQDKLILTVPLSSGKTTKPFAKAAAFLAAGAGATLHQQANSFADWLRAALLVHPDGGVLRQLSGNRELLFVQTESTMAIKVCDDAVQLAEEPDADTENKVPETDPALVEKLRQNFAWQYPAAALAQVPAKVSVTSIVHKAEQTTLERPGFLSKDGLTAAEMGTALHAFLEHADFARLAEAKAAGTLDAAIPAERDRQVALQLTAPEIAEKLDAVCIRRFVESEAFARICAAQQVLRELPFITALPAGAVLAAQGHEELPAAADAQVLVQGIADLVLVYPDHLELLDYKTDRRKAESDFLRAYRAQLNLYAIAIEKRFAPKKVTYKGIYSFALGKLIEA